MKTFIFIVAIGIIFIQFACGEISNEEQRKNVTTKYYLQELPQPPIIEIVKDDNWFPWKTPINHMLNDVAEYECPEESSKGEFPDDLFTQEQRLNGAIVLHFIGAIYFFTTTGILINTYYLPCIQCICDALKITPDVGAAVFMSTATCTPELFTNIIGTFIAESDMGLGAVIGSLMFNMLGVAAVASFATRRPVQMDWVPITRDCVVFGINVIVLIATTFDGYITWYEALILMIFAIPYYIIMFQSARISRFMKRKFEVEYGCCNRNIGFVDTDLEKTGKDNEGVQKSISTIPRESIVSRKEPQPEEGKIDEKTLAENKKADEEREAHLLLKKQRLGLWPIPKDTWYRNVFWFYTWLIRLVLRCTVINPKTHPRWYPLTFLLCIVWIGINTYFIFFMLIIISYTFSIPESVMGITVFAIGGCTPEIITGFIMARRGNSNVGVSNSVGASSLAIVISLAVPWFFRAVIMTEGHEKPYVNLHTNGMEFVILSLLLLTICLYLILFLRRFILTKITGLILILTYGGFVTLAVLMEMGFIFDIICIPY